MPAAAFEAGNQTRYGGGDRIARDFMGRLPGDFSWDMIAGLAPAAHND
jgi:hypothetical protein